MNKLSLDKQIKFVEQCENNIDKLNFYLDMSHSDISCEPCLVIKRYYKWSLKNIYNADIEEKESQNYFLKVIEKLDYKVVANMEYSDFRNLVVAYFSLGEIYYLGNDLELSKEYFTKVIDTIEEFLKVGNKFQTEEVKDKNGVALFEMLMWARKNLGDMVEIEVALELYESMLGEEELLYLQKHYSIYRVCKELNIVEKANVAARSIMKILPNYKNINMDVVDYLTVSKDYYNALDIAIDQYNKNDINYWINAINTICRVSENLTIECVDRVIEFCGILIEDLKVVKWSNISLTLYKNIRADEAAVIKLLDYLGGAFKKINYKRNDFSNCSQAIMVLDEIYEDIRIRKYNEIFLRKYEFDFVFYLMNTALQNKDYELGLESATKLASIIEICNIDKDIQKYVVECEEICSNNIKGNKYELKEYPWSYLYKNVANLCEKYGVESKLNPSDMARNNSKKIIVGINAIQNKAMEDILNKIIGGNIFREDKELVFISNEELFLNESIKKNYSYDVIIKKNLFKDINRCIITYDKSSHANIADKNIIVVDGHKELRDIDITYLKHIFEISKCTEVIIVINRKCDNYNEEILSYNKMVVENLLGYENEIKVIDLEDFKEEQNSTTILEIIMGESTKEVMASKFKDFTEVVKGALNIISDDITFNKTVYKETSQTLKDCLEEYENIQDEINTNYNEFISKIKGDIEFLGEYADAKIESVIPDLIEKNIDSIDNLEDISILKAEAEKIFGEKITRWCKKNIYDLMLEQFEVYIAKYANLYGYHKESIAKIDKNRSGIVSVHSEFSSKMKEIYLKPLEELMKTFLEHYDGFLKNINYEVEVIPNDKFLVSITEGIKGMFLKSEEKAGNSRVKIKNQVMDNKENISGALSDNIKQHLEEVSNKLQCEVEKLFESAISEVELDKSMVKNIIKNIDAEHSEKMIKNEEIETIMNFIKVEVAKYTKQVEHSIVYSKNKCYQLE